MVNVLLYLGQIQIVLNKMLLANVPNAENSMISKTEIVFQQVKIHSANQDHVNVEQENVWNAEMDTFSITMEYVLLLLKIAKNTVKIMEAVQAAKRISTLRMDNVLNLKYLSCQ